MQIMYIMCKVHMELALYKNSLNYLLLLTAGDNREEVMLHYICNGRSQSDPEEKNLAFQRFANMKPRFYKIERKMA